MEGLSITGFANGLHFTDAAGGDLIAGDFIGLTAGRGRGGQFQRRRVPRRRAVGHHRRDHDRRGATSSRPTRHPDVYAQRCDRRRHPGRFHRHRPHGHSSHGQRRSASSLVRVPFSRPSAGPRRRRGNLISASGIDGIQLNDSIDALIEGNLIGTDVTGTAGRWATAGDGIDVFSAEFTATDDAILDNVISANGGGIGLIASTEQPHRGQPHRHRHHRHPCRWATPATGSA